MELSKTFEIRCPFCRHRFTVPKSELADKVLGAQVDVLRFHQHCPKCSKVVGTWTARDSSVPNDFAVYLTYRGIRIPESWIVTIYPRKL